MLFGIASFCGDDRSADQDASPFTVVFYKEASLGVGPIINPEIIEIYDIFDRYRKYVGDFVSDPAPIDLARVMGNMGDKVKVLSQEDELSQLTKNIQAMDKNELSKTKDGLEAKVNRLRTAIKMVDTSIKGKTR